LPGKEERHNIEDLGNGKYRIRWQFKDSTGKWRSRQRDIIAESEKDAKRVLDDINYELRHKTYIDRSRMTVGEQIEEWFGYHQYELGDKERSRYKESIRLHIIPEIGHILLSDFCKRDVQDFYAKKRTGGRKDGKAGGLSSGSLHRFHTIINQAMEDAVDKERIGKNPLRKIKSPKGAKPGEVINPLNEEQVPIFLKSAEKDRHYKLWFCFLGTGCRPEELLALNRMRLDLRNKTITISEVVVCINGRMVPKPITKTDKSRRTIKISDAVVEVFKAQLAEVDAWKQKVGPKLFKDIGLVFPSDTGSYLNPSNLASRHFKPILKAADVLPDIRIYDLRHTHATLLFRRCKDIKLVSERLGHSDVAITIRTYYHLLPGTEDEAVAMFDDVLTRKVLDKPGAEPKPERSSEDVCVNSCVTNNVIAFPTGGLLKQKTRK